MNRIIGGLSHAFGAIRSLNGRGNRVSFCRDTASPVRQCLVAYYGWLNFRQGGRRVICRWLRCTTVHWRPHDCAVINPVSAFPAAMSAGLFNSDTRLYRLQGEGALASL
ncbi:hypothetical protein, partial [Achromobacter ruhlandii]|uniref:hypothetical protein n=1 Tax=Achromobacter ruhlandii TaxID=72557 RepID=UPI001C703C6D